MEGVFWILVPSRDFDATVAFFEDVMGYPVEQRGTPKDDPQYLRYAMVRAPNGIVLEVLEPAPACRTLYTHPVISISVKDLKETRRALEAAGIDFLTDTYTDQAGQLWTYFREPGGGLLQVSEDSNAGQNAPISEGEDGVEWLLVPTEAFDATVAFFEEVMGFPVEQRGKPVNDLQFLRYAVIRMRNGMVLELVEPAPEAAERLKGAVVCLTVQDLGGMRAHLEGHGVAFASGIIDTKTGLGWTYFQVPGATVFQLQGGTPPRTA